MAKTRSKKITKIDVNKFNKLMIMQMKVFCERYSYLLEEFNDFSKRPYDRNDDFVEEYYDFYALNASPDFKKDSILECYFNLMKTKEKLTVDEVVEKLKNTGETKSNHVSFASKLCHTIDNNVPLFDSRIKEYLHAVYHLQINNFDDVNKWYTNSQYEKDREEMIAWFRKRSEFKNYTQISDVKVVDSIIFIWHKYYLAK